MKKLVCFAAALVLSLFLNTCAYAQEPPEPDYLAAMAQAAEEGDLETGLEAERLREEQLARLAGEDPEAESGTPVSFEELLLLSRLIYSEAGSNWLSDEFRMCVGEVALNRVESPEFPDSLKEVVYQEGQYEGVNTEEFKSSLPSKECVAVALRLLLGERMLEKQVVFQANFRQGTVYATFSDRVLGHTYFCESPNLELYSQPEAPAPEGGGEADQSVKGK